MCCSVSIDYATENQTTPCVNHKPVIKRSSENSRIALHSNPSSSELRECCKPELR